MHSTEIIKLSGIYVLYGEKNMPVTRTSRHNSNVTLGEVLNGQAVFVYDNGKSQGAYTKDEKEQNKKLSYVQELLNQVVTRKRLGYADIDSTEKIPNAYTLLGQQGYYKTNTYNAVNAFKNYFKHKVNTHVKYSMAAGTNPVYDAADTTSQIFRKLMKDYGYRKAGGEVGKNAAATDESSFTTMSAVKWLNGIIDRDTLIGNEPRVYDIADARAFGWTPAPTIADTDYKPADNGGKDTGLYELYLNVVKPFVGNMIGQAEEYADFNGKQWYDRSATKQADTKQTGISYSFGGKQTIREFENSVTTQCPTPGSTKKTATLYYTYHDDKGVTQIGTTTPEVVKSTTVDAHYAGKIDETGSACPSPLAATSGKKYPGLVDFELESFDKGRAGTFYQTKSADNELTDPWPAYAQFNPSYWAGIDCSGLVQRSIETAKAWETPLEIRVTIPGFKGTLADHGMDVWAVGSNQFECDGAVQEERCKWGTQYIRPKDARVYTIDKENKDIILRGDVIRYPGHVAMVYSDNPACTKDKNDQTTCTYEIVHASGYNYIDFNGNNINDPGEFSRKVRTNSSIWMPQPTGFGRIKLWD